ncbi:glutathione S-transferase family protein [Fertoebacter nigrum]|uniref:Glutathione S-transferase family protein n=1 Tax=Fertoeibacter niger TaxID=2656921 RepID=A0A8X8H465_9RHOB|nr:glutathione S-transferase family protein [Fertoeibacter niger]NUB46034.1 glutathione S-transferase family protein [Fertoeibacter niger]
MESLTLYTNPQSRGRIARWMLEELGQPYDTVILGYGPDMQAESYRTLNPMAKVPTVTHGTRTITECAAICTYLADAFPEARLMPDDRAAFYRWMFYAAGPLEAAVTNKALGVTVPPEKSGFVGYGSFDRVVATLEQAVSASPYLAGDTFSAVDVYAGSQIGWGLQFGTLPALPGFTAYWDRIKTRPALARANAADDALIAKG